MIPGLYRHYKGDVYRAVAEIEHGDTHEPMVLYITPEKYGSKLCVRTVEQWEEEVGPDLRRFTFIGEQS